MISQSLTWLNQIMIPELKVMLTAALPVLELKASLPLGIGLGMHPAYAFLLSYIGSLLPVPFLFLLIRPVFKWIKQIEQLKGRIEALERRTIHKSVKIQKYGVIGLFMFVAIPLPGTGVWTGTLGAVLLDIRFKWAFPAICIGNFVAGMIIMLLSNGIFTLFQ
ncbi:MAG: hypothetical protein PWP38_2925 [Clostridiales bacterium]|nr:hypothetical protein [Clostridiales bacterium]